MGNGQLERTRATTRTSTECASRWVLRSSRRGIWPRVLAGQLRPACVGCGMASVAAALCRSGVGEPDVCDIYITVYI